MRAVVIIAIAVLACGPVRADEAQARKDCMADALRYCKRAIVTRDLNIIIACMITNKDKLQVKCSRHLI